MIDLIAKLISGDGITTIAIIALGYLGLLWFLFSFWVYIDAKKRYKRNLMAIIFFLVVLIFNFPALVFYLITRPEDEGEFVLLPADTLASRGINVPIVNFIGKDGKVAFSFEMKINNSDILANSSDMAIDVNWKSNNAEFQKVEEVIITPEVVEEAKVEKTTVKQKTTKALNRAKKNANDLKSKVKSFKPQFNLPAKKAKDSTKASK